MFFDVFLTKFSNVKKQVKKELVVTLRRTFPWKDLQKTLAVGVQKGRRFGRLKHDV
jgi:hypothetical protein